MEDLIELGIELILGLIGIALEKLGPINEFPKPIKYIIFSILGLIYIAGIILLNIIGIWLVKNDHKVGGIVILIITEIILIFSIMYVLKIYRKRSES